MYRFPALTKIPWGKLFSNVSLKWFSPLLISLIHEWKMLVETIIDWDYWDFQFKGSRTFQVCTKCLLNVFRAMTEDVYLQWITPFCFRSMTDEWLVLSTQDVVSHIKYFFRTLKPAHLLPRSAFTSFVRPPRPAVLEEAPLQVWSINPFFSYLPKTLVNFIPWRGL